MKTTIANRFNISDLTKVTRGKLLSEVQKDFDVVSTDSRSIQKGDFFVALTGENFDAHDFLKKAYEKGAIGLLISKPLTSEQKSLVGRLTIVQVEDTVKALQEFAHFWRLKNTAKVVAITGSNGKTTTKFFLKDLLEGSFNTFASEKSFNNHIGVPLTLLNIDKKTEVCICEIGTNHQGEIKTLTEIAEPDISIVTTIGEAHIGYFGTKDLIGREKQEIYNNNKRDPARVYNLDNQWTQKMYLDYKNPTRALTFSANNANADVYMKTKNENTPQMAVTGFINRIEGTASISFFGTQNVYNLMAAAGLALWCGMSAQKIWERIPFCKTDWGRNQLIDLKSKAKLIFDAYNANPDSMKALVENGNSLKKNGKKILILGDMFELGDLTIIRHEELGQIVGKGDFDIVWFLGKNAPYFERGIISTGFQKKLYISDSYKESLALEIASMLEPHDVILMKGSRGAKLEQIVPHLNPINWELK